MTGKISELEVALFQRFVAWSGLLTDGVFEFPNPPDVLATEHGRKYSVEIRRFADRPKAHREGVRRDIVNDAKRLFERAGLGLADVSVLWGSAGDHLDRTKRSKITHALFDLVRLHATQNVGDVEVGPEIIWAMDGSPLQPVLHSVHVRRYLNQKRGHWTVPEAGFVPRIEAEDIQKIIDHKAAKISTYQAYVDEAWLLIPIGWGGPSSFGELQAGLLDHAYSAPFDRVFLMPWGKVHHLLLNTVDSPIIQN